MYHYLITYIELDEYGRDNEQTYEIESACNSVGLFMLHHRWAIDYIEKQHQIVSITILDMD